MLSLYTYLKQITDVPFLADHVVVCLPAADASRFRMDQNLLYNETHAFETVHILLQRYSRINVRNTCY